MIENRNGLVVATSLSQATGTAEREAALELMNGGTKAKGTTLAADKSYDTKDFVKDCRNAGITPHWE